jgi:hypothetical protein
MIVRRIVLLRIIEILLNIRLTITDVWFTNCAFNNSRIVVIVTAIIIWHSIAATTITIMVTTTAHLCDNKKIYGFPHGVLREVFIFGGA